MTFYKILDFKYNGRKFSAFRNKLGYQTFLEYSIVNEKRFYNYVDEATYRDLYEIFLKKSPSFYDDGKKKSKMTFSFIPKVISSVGLAVILSSSLSGCAPGAPSNGASRPQLWPNQMFDENEVIITDDYEVYEIVKSVNLLTVDGMTLYWGEKESNVSFDMVRDAVAKNTNIDETLANYLYNFLDKLEAKCPNINLGCFYYNVTRLSSHCANELGMMQACGSSTATACFLADDSTIYYNDEKLDDENFEYIMNHEIGHMLLNGNKEVNGYETERHYTTGSNAGYMIEEGFDTLLIEDVIGVSMNDVSYRLPANYVRILMDSIGYTFEDYVNGYHLEFEGKIKEYLNDPEFDVDNFPFLVEYQKYNIRQNKDVEIEESEFHDLYEVIAGVYFKKNIEFCTSSEDIRNLYDNLIQDIIRDVYSKEGEYTFDFTGLIDGMKRTLANYNISKDLWPSDEELETSIVVGEPVEELAMNIK